MLVIAAKHDYEIIMLDVKTASLNDDNKEEVHVKTAPVYEPNDTSETSSMQKLRKSDSCLLQSPNIRFGTLNDHLSNIVFHSLTQMVSVRLRV